MDDTTTARVKDLIQQLDGLVRSEGAAIKIRQVGGGPDESAIIANRAGFLRGGIEFMKAAFAGGEDFEPSRGVVVECGLDDLLTEDSDIGFDYVQRNEDLKQQSKVREKGAQALIAFVAGVVVLSLLICMIIGIVTVLGWMFW